MFFFIGGIQPKTVTVDEHPRMCPSCGLFQARLKRVDHYISLFFLPIFPIKKGVPCIICDRCGSVSQQEMGDIGTLAGSSQPGTMCLNCRRSLEPGFHYCPFCGKAVR